MKRAKYIRLYADERGESHFEDLEIELNPMDYAPPASPLNIAEFLPTEQSLWVGAPVGWDGEEPHPTPRRQIFCTVKGEYEVTASDGDVRRFPVGSVLLLEDTWGKGHTGRVIGDEGFLLLSIGVPGSQSI